MQIMFRQMFRFLVTGSITTSLSYIIFLILFRLVSFHYLLSSAAGYVSGIFLSYIINKRWTFEIVENESSALDTNDKNRSLSNKIQIIKYFSVYVFSLIAGLVVLKIFVSCVGIRAEISNIISIAFSTCTNFFGMKFLVFKK